MKSNLVNKVWCVLVFISAGIALWFFITASLGVWNYAKLEARTSASVDAWHVEEENPSRFVVLGHYNYQVAGKGYEGETKFDRVYYLNRQAAEGDLGKWREMRWEVWYNPGHPEESSLQRMFPFKSCLYALLTLGVLIYFLILRYFTFSRSIWKNDL